MSLLRSGAVLFGASMAGNFCNYLFQFFMSRHLSIEDYGALNAALSLTSITGIPTATIMLVVANYASTFNARREAGNISLFYRNSLLGMTALGGIFFLALFLLSGPVSGYLKITTPLTITLVGAGLFFSFILTVNMGMLQGLKRFYFFGAGMWLSAASRLALGVIFVIAGLGLNGAVAATAVPALIVLLLTLFPLSIYFGKAEGARKITGDILSYSVPVLLSSFAFTAMTNIDMIVIKHAATPEEAGLFSAVAVLGKIILYLPSAFVLALFPMISESHARRSDIYKVLDKGLLYTCALAAAGVAGMFLFPELALRMLFGHKYLAAAPLLKFYGFAMLCTAVLNVIVNFNLARRKSGFIYSIAAGAAAIFVLIDLFHGSLTTVVLIVAAVNVAVVVVNLFSINRDRKAFNAVAVEAGLETR